MRKLGVVQLLKSSVYGGPSLGYDSRLATISRPLVDWQCREGPVDAPSCLRSQACVGLMVSLAHPGTDEVSHLARGLTPNAVPISADSERPTSRRGRAQGAFIRTLVIFRLVFSLGSCMTCMSFMGPCTQVVEAVRVRVCTLCPDSGLLVRTKVSSS